MDDKLLEGNKQTEETVSGDTQVISVEYVLDELAKTEASKDEPEEVTVLEPVTQELAKLEEAIVLEPVTQELAKLEEAIVLEPATRELAKIEEAAVSEPPTEEPIHSSIWDKLTIGFGALILAAVVLIAITFVNGRLTKINEQISTDTDPYLRPRGLKVETEGLSGEDKFNEILASEKERLKALEEAKAFSFDEEDEDHKTMDVSLALTSIVKDLKIKIVNSNNKLVANIPFKVEVKREGDDAGEYTDTDKDGIIYLDKIEGGKYTVKLLKLDGYDSKVNFATAASLVTVKTEADYRKVDVSNEIKKESEVDVKKEDTKVSITTESENKDTVEYVASSKRVISNEEGYTLITNRAETCKKYAGYNDVSSGDPKELKKKLKDNDKNQVYRYSESKKDYVKATVADYFKPDRDLFLKTGVAYAYTGWQFIDGYTYFFTKDEIKVTGDQVIQGAKYSFDSEGRLSSGTGKMGIDVSTWNGTIDWNTVASSGVAYAIIRCGFRGSTEGGLIEDACFDANIKGAAGAGIKTGVYFFTQAVNEVEAIEEASMVLEKIKGYKLSYPVFIDIESAGGGRAKDLTPEERTAVCTAFCKTIENAGYSAGVYSNKNWFELMLDVNKLTGYKLWLAQYADTPTYTKSRYDLWQYSENGTIPGITGTVDLNLSYLNY